MKTGIPYSHARTSAMRYSHYLIVLLGILTAFGPLVTDMYLPTLPSMTVYFGTSQSMVQMGLTTSMAGLALGQLLFGPTGGAWGAIRGTASNLRAGECRASAGCRRCRASRWLP